jgi:hypothetical protein
LYRTLQLTVDGQGNVVRKANAPKLVSPNDIVLNNYNIADSGLLKEFRALAISYFNGKQTSEAVAAKRKAVTKKAEIENKKDALKAEIKLQGIVLDKATEALALDMQNPLLQAKFKKAQLELDLANLKLDNAQKEIDKSVAEFDDYMAPQLARLESLNLSTETLSKQLTGGNDKGTSLALGNYLRSELLYNKIHNADGTPQRAIWLEANVSANGANQMKKSSPIFDIFTRGPMTSYSGGSVVNYQLRMPDGEVSLEGTVWAYAEYRKSSKIMDFKCAGLENKDITTRWMNL